MISNNLKNYFFNHFNIRHKLTQKPNFNETYRLHDFKRYNNLSDGFYYIMDESFRVKIRKSSLRYFDNIKSLQKQTQIFSFCVEFTCKFEKVDNH